MASIEEIKTLLAAAIDAARQADAAFAVAAAEVSETTAQVLRLLHDTRNEDAERCRAALAGAAAQVDPTRQHLAGVVNGAHAYLRQIG